MILKDMCGGILSAQLLNIYSHGSKYECGLGPPMTCCYFVVAFNLVIIFVRLN